VVPMPRALDIDEPVRLPDDPVHHREPEPGPLPDGLGGVEGLEDPVEVGSGDPGPGVGDGEFGVRAGGHHVAEGDGPCLRDAHEPRGQPDGPTMRHRIARVEDQIHHHLVELTAVRSDGARPRPHVRGQRDGGTDHAPQHRVEPRDRVPELEDAHTQRLLPSEREELAREIGGATGRACDLIQQFARIVRQRAIVAHQVEVAADDREEVVKVVGDPAGQLPDSLHLLRLPQLLLKEVPFGDITEPPDPTDGRAVEALRMRGQLDPPAIAQAERLRGLAALLRRTTDGGERGGLLECRTDDGPERGRIMRRQCRGGLGPHRRKSRVPTDHPRRQVDNQHAELVALHRGLQQRQCVPHLVALTDRLAQRREPGLQFPRYRFDGPFEQRAVGVGLAIRQLDRLDERHQALRDRIERPEVPAQLPRQELVAPLSVHRRS